jgi:hypothetical protein
MDAAEFIFPPDSEFFGQAITWGVDQSLKNPHAYTVDFSVRRELPKRFTLQFAYGGSPGTASAHAA